MKCMVNDDVVLSRPLEGPLSAHIAPFAMWAREQGYARRSRHRQVLVPTKKSVWPPIPYCHSRSERRAPRQCVVPVSRR